MIYGHPAELEVIGVVVVKLDFFTHRVREEVRFQVGDAANHLRVACVKWGSNGGFNFAYAGAETCFAGTDSFSESIAKHILKFRLWHHFETGERCYHSANHLRVELLQDTQWGKTRTIIPIIQHF